MAPKYSPHLPHEERRQARRVQRKKRAMRRRLNVLCGLAAVVLLVGGFTKITRSMEEQLPPQDPASISVALPQDEVVEQPPVVEPEVPKEVWTACETTAEVDSSFPSRYVLLADLESGEILAQRSPDTRINPASMTKILTLLVAVENIPDDSGTYTMNFDITDYCYVNKCSVVGYIVDEVIPVSELFYGCILNSGADACLALADVAAGSHEGFVDLMNAKLEELGISETTHFTNCVGLYDEDHYTTVKDMATILKAALDNDKAREVLSTRVFTISATNKHEQPQDMSNWFIRRIEDKDTGAVTVKYAKTGYVSESGFCAASGGVTEDGRTYLCVTGDSTSTQQSIHDHAALYKEYIR